MTSPLKALVRQPTALMAEACELTHLERQPIDMGRALEQHAAYAAALARCGAEVITLPPLEDHADCCFVEDTLLSLPEIVIACRPGVASRRGEVATSLAAYPDDRPRARILSPATIEGGDLFVVDRTIFAGLSSRTNTAGIASLAEAVAPFGYAVTTIPIPGALHLKTACTAPADDLVLINPQWVDPSIFGAVRIVTVSDDEPFAANALSINGTVLIAAAHPRTAQRLADQGLAVDMLDVSEFAKAEAGMTCLSVIIKPPAA